MNDSPFPQDPSYADPDILVYQGISDTVQRNFHVRGATGVRVTAWAKRDNFQVRHVTLASEAFEAVDLSLDQVSMILDHLFPNSTTETVFVMAQAVADHVDLDLVYDAATGLLKTPHAKRKAVVA